VLTVPYLFVEAFLMQIIYEILREAGVRLPRPVGQAVSIVGALVIGEASVTAGLIGAPMVIVVALTAIASFVVPALSDVSSLSRLFLLILAGFSGQFGIMLGIADVLAHLCSLRSFGVPIFKGRITMIIATAHITAIIFGAYFTASTAAPVKSP